MPIARLAPPLFVRALVIGLLALPLLLPGTTFAQPAAADEPTVTIKDYVFSPAVTTVPVGTTITWTNADADPHTATSIEGTSVFDSNNIATGGTYPFTFTAPGTYPYVCTYHDGMQGTVIVTER